MTPCSHRPVKPFCSFGHVWVVLALWVPLPIGGARGVALPLLVRLNVGSKRGGTRDAPGRLRRGTGQQAAEHAHAAHPRPTKLALARDLLPITISGWQVTPLVLGCTALWYGALRDQPVRILRCLRIIVRASSGRGRDEAFSCTDLAVDHAVILESYARRWTIEATFHDQKQGLGFGNPQNQTPEAVARTAPMASIAYDLILLWYAARVQQGLATARLVRPWYRSKTTPSFLDMLTAVRQESWRLYFSDPPLPGPSTQ